VEHAGRAYPAAIAEAWPVGIAEATEPAFLDPELLAAGRSHLDEVARRTPRLYDGPVLALDRVEGETLHTRPSGYLATVATADALRAEWEREGFGPLRARAHEVAGSDPLRNGNGRAAAVGLAVVTALGGRVLLGRRSDNVAADPGLWHTAPSGMLEPGVDLADQMGRELEEELGPQDVGWSAEVLGLGFDLLRLRPEVCWSLEPIDEPELRLGEEFVEARWIDPAVEWPEDLTPAAATALALFLANHGRSGVEIR